ncbi:MAG: hypothetical protein GVY06_10620 [Alphaproteobacteria bacterium]|jgi:hypothetical protein|nr:hypothetical protein [Alphaproteobacteria bacterium]
MKSSADEMINEMGATLASYEASKASDAELEELFRVAEAAMDMLVILRRHQLECRRQEYDRP